MTEPIETLPAEIPPVEQILEPEIIILESEFQGGIMTSAIRNMVGIPPKGFEFVEYAVGAAFFIILVAIVASVFVGFSKMLGAK